MFNLDETETEKHGAGMAQGGADHGETEARTMLDLFASVGATAFDLSIIDRSGGKVSFRRGIKLSDLTRTLPTILSNATRRQDNVIVRPHGSGVSLVQLDDLKGDMLAKLAPAVFLILQTSQGNFQAWVAITGTADKDLARRLRKGTGADDTASGATRIAGSLNFKDKYAPDFPRVALVQAQYGRTATVAQLDELGLVAAPDPARPAPRRRHLAGTPRAWPDYARCVGGAPFKPDGSGPDISRADYVWCLTALDWGWSVEATAARLMDFSRKAQENGESYAERTAESAAAALARRGTTRKPPFDSPKQR